MDSNILHDCLHRALQGKLSFPETIGRMNATGVERYRADLVRMEKTHYGINGETHIERFALPDAPPIPEELSSRSVKEAIGAIQQGEIDYPEFLRRIMLAGVTDYGVWLRGRRAIYSGRAGDFYIEPFPRGN